MTSKVHIHLKVSDLPRSKTFYRKLWGHPVKEKPDYAKFLPSFAPLNLAITPGSPAATASHFGIQMTSPEEVREQLTRIKAEGLPVREEMGVDCCYANQDKFWIRDPDGTEWEIYSINHDLEGTSPKAAGCCPAPR